MYIGIVRDYVTDLWNKLWPVVHKYLVIVWDFLSENVPFLLAKAQELLTTLAYKVYELAPDFFSSVASWFAKLGEKIVEKLPDVLAVIQEYAVIAVNLAVNLINSVVEWIQNMAGRYVVILLFNQNLRQTSLLKSFSNHTVKHPPGFLFSLSVSATNTSLLFCCSTEVEDGVQQTPPMTGSSKPV